VDIIWNRRKAPCISALSCAMTKYSTQNNVGQQWRKFCPMENCL